MSLRVGQADIISGVPLGSISMSVRARFKVSACSGYDFATLVDSKVNFYILTIMT